MSVRVRMLPEWLVSLGNENVPAKTKTVLSRKRGNSAPKNVSVCDSNDNDNYSLEIKSGGPICTTEVGENSKNEGNSTPCGTKSSNTSGKLVNRSGTMQEMSDSEEDVPDTSDLTILEGRIQEEQVDAKQVTPPCVQGENDSNDETDDELDFKANVDVIAAPNPSVAPVSVAVIGNNIGIDINNSNDTDIGQEPSQSASDNTAQIARPKCKYGSQCYRKNPQHQRDFSHPEDADYTAVDNRPECEYGLECYRKNPLHRQHYKHTQKVQKPRQAKRPRKKLVNDASDDEDDYDLDDPFIDDGSSDDYEPSASDSETDFEPDEAEANDNGDSESPVKEIQKPKKKQRH